MSYAATVGIPSAPRTQHKASQRWDRALVWTTIALLGLGLVMVGSASISLGDRQSGEPFYYLFRQATTVGMGLMAAMIVLAVPIEKWLALGLPLLGAAFLLLVAVLIPGLGHTVNGSSRWLTLGPINVQVSEFAKLAMVIYIAGYLVRHGEAVRTTVGGFLKPMVVAGLFALLLLLEPDFGAMVVMMTMVMGMMFLGGVRLWLFGVLLVTAAAAFVALAISSPYRLERLTAFMNPWADPFNSGYQLTQALIAFGRGEWLGVGLGGSVQKLFYMPEAHTDFLFAVLAEELGLVGVVAVIALFGFLVWRIFQIGARAARAKRMLGSHLSFGIGLWLALQAFINMGVNMGVLPTKGLTLPLMSYGRSSILVILVAIALVLRVDYEVGMADRGGKVTE